MLVSTAKAAIPLIFLFLTSVVAECFVHSFTSCPPDNIVHWYDPNTGEICDPLDCGGGRAPPKYDVPGCPFYTGTEVRKTTPSYLPCWTPPTPPGAIEAAATSAPGPTRVPPASFVGTTTTAVAPETSGDLSTADVSSSTESAGSAASPSTTPPPSPPTTSGNSGSSTGSSTGSSMGASSMSVTASQPTTSNVGSFLEASIIVGAGAAIGVVALL
mgnify:CR=1 FL=1